MDIGIARENRPNEKRVILRPDELKKLTSIHSVFVEQGAGEGIKIEDEDYKKAGARIADKNKVYSCSLVVRLKEPKEEELSLMRPGSVIMSMLHLPGNPELRDLLKKYKIIGIAMEEIRDPFGQRMIEALYYAGYLGMEKGFQLRGGEASKSVCKIMGYGNVSFGAIQCAARRFAKVEILNKRDFKDMRRHIPGTDILVNAINWPIEKRGKEFFITSDMLRLFKKGSVLLDLISNPKGQSPIETMHPTYLDNISYAVDGIIHASCWAWPGLDPVNVSRRYSIQVAPILKEIADTSLDNLPGYIRNALHLGQ
jgi:alanine dehydrogenase